MRVVLVHAVDDVGVVGLEVEAVKLGALDQRVDDGGAVLAGIRADEEIVLPVTAIPRSSRSAICLKGKLLAASLAGGNWTWLQLSVGHRRLGGLVDDAGFDRRHLAFSHA